MKLHALLIDPQVSFADPNGSLFVPGADQDMSRAAAMIRRLKGKIDDIHVTLDSHRLVDIAHPIWFKDSSGNHPNPFTIISASDLMDGVWTTTRPGAFTRTLEYLKALEDGGRYPHCIWPPHCLIGSGGHNVVPELFDAFQEWEQSRHALVDYVTKGSNPWTEHFSGVQAEVPDAKDPTTQLNTKLVSILEEADIVLVAGEARSHCMANTIRDIVNAFSNPDYVKKLVLLTDACSDVPSFENLGEAFVNDMTALGMQTSTTTDFLK